MAKGVVARISKKDWEGKTLTSFALKGQDGWYSIGERAPTFTEGSSIEFDVVTRGSRAYAQNIVPWVDGGAATAPGVESVSNAQGRAPSRGFQKGSGGSFRGGKSDEEKAYWAKRDEQQEVTQRRIEIQAARNAAIEAATVMWEREIVKIPTKQADKYDAFMALVETLTDDFLGKTSSRLSVHGNSNKGSVDKASREVGENPPTNTEQDNGDWD